ncbi:MAG TPA: alanine/glycine:cation symporter family protein, partial [Longimicrobium sp.]|nr:alanine/glycine:cation symporter family protein [Longimicrobium sp.]
GRRSVARRRRSPPVATSEQSQPGIMGSIDRAMGAVNGVVSFVFFYDMLFWDAEHQLPLVVLWLVLGAIFFTIKMGFVNFRGFGHAIQVVRGRYSDPSDAGEVSHFQALSTALSATVGLGNIAGVAIAVSVGGPGATFWMIVAGLLGMSSKFAECTLGQQYREVRPDGRIMGGAMEYLSKGLKEKGWPRLGMFLAVMFSILCIGGSLGGGNSFQVNQSLNAMQETIPFLADAPWVYGLVMTVLVGLVIVGGIRRIATVAEKIVPLMCGVYVLAALFILLMNFTAIPAAFGAIISQAFTPAAGYGGFIGVLVTGFRRAAFSNEAGAGSAAIAHSAARTPYPVREGFVSLLEPFIDTVVVCTMTALVIVITGAYNNPAYADLVAQSKGAALTSRAMSEHLPWFKYILSAAVFLFAYSTMISWSYYGERCWAWLLGDRSTKVYQGLFLLFVFLGSVITSVNVLEFGDLMILGMAFPNILGVVILSGNVKRELDDYWRRLKSGEIRPYDGRAAVARG